MPVIEEIAAHLKKDLPSFNFIICRGLFANYISIEAHGQIIFTVWVDRNSGHAELPDEVNMPADNWLKKRLKSRLFHWSKYRNLWRRDYPRIMLEKMKLNLTERKLIRQRIELSLRRIHIV